MSSGRFSFPKICRLTSAADYQHVFSEPARFSSKYFSIFARENHISHPRLGFAVSKKHIKPAVSRNRIKRIVRERFRLRKNELENLDIVVTAHNQAITASTDELRKSFDKYLDYLKSANV